MTAPRLSVVIPSFNRIDGLRLVLEGYEAQRPRDLPFEVVVVDDGSDDGTSDMLAGWRSSRFRLRFDRQANQGPARARNRGLEIVSGEIVLFGGDDIEPHPRQIAEHLREHDRRADFRTAVLGLTRWPDSMALTSTMRHIDGPGGQQFSYAAFDDGAEYDFRHFYTSNVSISRRMLAMEPAGFSDEFPSAAFEDAELAYRLSGKGMRIVYHQAAEAWHHHPYDARSFFRRQVTCGEMAEVLIRQHPQLAKWTELDELGWSRIEFLAAGDRHRRAVDRVASELDRWERRVIDLAVFLDHPPTAIADPLLQPLFRYGFLKGLARAHYGNRVGGRLAAGWWFRMLPQAVEDLALRAAEEGVPLPRSDLAAVLGMHFAALGVDPV
jgi:glycosyltransferase involved in cell wall biosynthesis